MSSEYSYTANLDLHKIILWLFCFLQNLQIVFRLSPTKNITSIYKLASKEGYTPR